jgi:hydroxymethylglutaryl-CoA lyase
VPGLGTGSYYYRDPNVVGLSVLEDMVVMMDEMGIDTGVNVDRILELGAMMERTVGRRLRSESILNGRIPKEIREGFKRPELQKIKEKNGEKPGQILPEEWPEVAEVPAAVLGQ